MDDPVNFILLILFGVLGIFIIVRIVKAASRTVDEEQQSKVAWRQPQKRTAFCGHCGKQVGDADADAFCTHCGYSLRQTPMPIPPVVVPTVKEIKLGMTPAEVEVALGLPETRVDLGEKVLYKYKNMTIEFHGEKVTDVS